MGLIRRGREVSGVYAVADETVFYLLLCVLSKEAEIIYCHVLGQPFS
jgi:hypothetical protein